MLFAVAEHVKVDRIDRDYRASVAVIGQWSE